MGLQTAHLHQCRCRSFHWHELRDRLRCQYWPRQIDRQTDRWCHDDGPSNFSAVSFHRKIHHELSKGTGACGFFLVDGFIWASTLLRLDLRMIELGISYIEKTGITSQKQLRDRGRGHGRDINGSKLKAIASGNPWIKLRRAPAAA